MQARVRPVSPSLLFPEWRAREADSPLGDLAVDVEESFQGTGTRGSVNGKGSGQGGEKEKKAGSNSHKTPATRANTGWIYELRFPNGKAYVGQTRSWHRRMRGHKCGSQRDDGHLIKRAIRKYGWSNIHVSVIEEVPLDLLNHKEVEWIAKKGTLKPSGYNTTAGGDDQPMNDPDVKARQKQRIGEAMRKPSVRAKKRALWKDREYREMQFERRNSFEAIKKRHSAFARRRAKRIASMGVAEGRMFIRNSMISSIQRARAIARRNDAVFMRELVKHTRMFWDEEIAEYEATVWRRTLASSYGTQHASVSTQVCNKGEGDDGSSRREWSSRDLAHCGKKTKQMDIRVSFGTKASA